MKYLSDFMVHFSDRPVFSKAEIRRFLGQKKISCAYLNHFVHYLLSSKKMKRVARGFYTLRKEPEVAGFAFSPFYYGLQEALSLHSLWEQETNPVIVTTKKVRPGVRQIMGANVVVRRISPKMFFGFEMLKHYNSWLPVSNPEKTLIDFVYFREPLSEGSLLGIKNRLRKDVLKKYLEKCSPRVRRRVEEYIKN